jgi:hypothetical protein
MLPSEKIELAIYRHVNLLEPPVNVSLPQLSQITGERDHARIAERLKDLAAHNRILLSKVQKGRIWPRGDTPDRFFFHTGSFLAEIAPQGRKYFEELEQHATQEQPLPSRKLPSNTPLLPSKKAIEIMRKLINDADFLSGEPFGSPKRELWEQRSSTLAGSFD